MSVPSREGDAQNGGQSGRQPRTGLDHHHHPTFSLLPLPHPPHELGRPPEVPGVGLLQTPCVFFTSAMRQPPGPVPHRSQEHPGQPQTIDP